MRTSIKVTIVTFAVIALMFFCLVSILPSMTNRAESGVVKIKQSETVYCQTSVEDGLWASPVEITMPGGLRDIVVTATSGSIPMFDVDEYLKGLSFGETVFNTPKDMKVKDKFVVNLVLSPNKIDPKNVPKAGNVESASVKIDKKMEAILKGSGFEIVEITDPVQAVSLVEDTVWKWEISPVKTGEQLLCLSLNIKVDIDGEKLSRSIKTFEKTIHVKVSPLGGVENFFSKNWQFLATGVFIPLFVWYWTHRRKRRARRKPTGP